MRAYQNNNQFQGTWIGCIMYPQIYSAHHYDNQHLSYITLHNSRMSYTRIMKFKRILVLVVFFDEFIFLYDKGFK